MDVNMEETAHRKASVWSWAQFPSRGGSSWSPSCHFIQPGKMTLPSSPLFDLTCYLQTYYSNFMSYYNINVNRNMTGVTYCAFIDETYLYSTKNYKIILEIQLTYTTTTTTTTATDVRLACCFRCCWCYNHNCVFSDQLKAWLANTNTR